MTFCPECGKVLHINDNFCPECGTPIEKPQQFVKPLEIQPQQSTKKSYRGLLIGFIAFLIIIVVIGAIVMLYDNNPLLSDGVITGDTSQVELVDTWVEHNTGYYEYDYYKGTVKNIAGRYLDRIDITLHFYDSNNNFLFSETDVIFNLANTYSKDFSIYVSSVNTYYKNIDHVKYDFHVR